MPSSRFAAPPHGRRPLDIVAGMSELRRRAGFPSAASFAWATVLQKLRLERRHCQHGAIRPA